MLAMVQTLMVDIGVEGAKNYTKDKVELAAT
jgi:hypothetical protein